MYAVLRLNSFDPVKLVASADGLEEFDKIHAAQPGYSLLVDLGAGRRFALNLWETEQRSASALQVLSPEVRRLRGPLTGQCFLQIWFGPRAPSPQRHRPGGTGVLTASSTPRRWRPIPRFSARG